MINPQTRDSSRGSEYDHRGSDGLGGLEQQQKLMIKEAYLSNALEKYKQKRKEEMGNSSQGRNNKGFMQKIQQNNTAV